jgi:chromosome segregation ATPase
MDKRLSDEAVAAKLFDFNGTYKSLLIQSEDLITNILNTSSDSANSVKKVSILGASRNFLQTLPLTKVEQDSIIKKNTELQEELLKLQAELLFINQAKNEIEQKTKEKFESDKLTLLDQIKKLNLHITTIEKELAQKNTAIDINLTQITNLESNLQTNDASYIFLKSRLQETIDDQAKKIDELNQQISKVQEALKKKEAKLENKKLELNDYATGMIKVKESLNNKENEYKTEIANLKKQHQKEAQPKEQQKIPVLDEITKQSKIEPPSVTHNEIIWASGGLLLGIIMTWLYLKQDKLHVITLK